MIDYYNISEQDFEQIFANIEDAILHYPYWDRNSHFFNSCCMNCGVIIYYDLPIDYYLVKKEYYDLLFCKDCWEDIAFQSAKKGVKFETEYYCYVEIIKDLKSRVGQYIFYLLL